MLTVYTGLQDQLLIRSKQMHAFKKEYHSNKNNMKIQHLNELVQKLGMSDTTRRVYQFIYDEKDSVDTKIIQYLLYMDWYYVSR